MPSPIVEPEGARGNANADAEGEDGNHLSTPPPPTDNKDQQAPGTVYHSPHSNMTATTAPPKEPTAEPATEEAAGLPSLPAANTSSAAAAAAEGSPVATTLHLHCGASSGTFTPRPRRMPSPAAEKDSSAAPVAFGTRPVVGLGDLMPATKIKDQLGFEPTADGVTVALGREDSCKSSLVNSICCPDGKQLVPVNVGPCTHCLITVKLIRSKKKREPVATVTLPDHAAALGDLSIEEAHDMIQSYMRGRGKSKGSSGDIGTIAITLVSPLVPTMNLVDTSGLLLDEDASFDAIIPLLAASNEPLSFFVCLKPTSHIDPGQDADALMLKKLRAVLDKRGYNISANNAIAVMSKIDTMVDHGHRTRAPELGASDGGKFWFFKKIMPAGAKMLDLPAVGIMNPDTTEINSSKDDIYTREKHFLDSNGITAETSAGREILAGLCDLIHREHIRRDTEEKIKEKSQELLRKERELEALGVDPKEPGVSLTIKETFQDAVNAKLSGVQAETAVNTVFEKYGNDPYEENFENLANEIAMEVGENAKASVVSAIAGAQGSDKMNIGRFVSAFQQPYIAETIQLLNSRTRDFVKESKKDIFYSKKFLMHGCVSKPNAVKSLKAIIVSFAQKHIIEPLRAGLEEDVADNLSTIELEEEDPGKREQLKADIAKLKIDVELLQKLLPANQEEDMDASENPAGSDNEKDDGGEDGSSGPTDRPKKESDGDKKSGTDTDGSTDYSSSSDDGDNNAGRGAGRSHKENSRNSSGNKERGRSGRPSVKCNRELASLSPWGVRTSPSRSVISVPSSSSEGEDCAPSSCPARRKRKGSHQSGGACLVKKRRKKDEKKNEKAAKAHFALLKVGVRVETFFPEDGWFHGVIIRKSKRKGIDYFHIEYEDKEEWEFSEDDLSDEQCHKIVAYDEVEASCSDASRVGTW